MMSWSPPSIRLHILRSNTLQLEAPSSACMPLPFFFNMIKHGSSSIAVAV